MKLKKAVVVVLACALLLGGLVGCRKKETVADYPSSAIELVVPYSAGGQVDITARILAKYLAEYLPKEQPVLVVNKPGASGTLAMEYVLDSPADGYRLAVSANGPVTTTPLIQNANYEYTDMLPMMQLAIMPNFICVSNESPIETAQDWLDYVRAGNEFKYSMIGIGATQHVTMERVNKAMDVKTVPIPYNGDAEAKTAMLQGNVDGFLTYPMDYDESQFRVLINLGEERSAFFPDVPTLKELGVDVSGYFNIVLVGQKDLPEELATILDDAFQKTLEDQRTQDEFNRISMELQYKDATALSDIMKAAVDVGVPILKELGLIE